MGHLDSLQQVIDQLTKLPGIGPRSAERIAYHLLKSTTDEAAALAQAILHLKERMRQCQECLGLSEHALCSLCNDPQRDRHLICVVEEPKDLLAIEKTGSFHGVYHVLWGAITPLEGIGPDQLKIPELLERIEHHQAQEVILSMDHDQEGEATALHLAEIIKARGVQVSRLAAGIPVGSNVEYTDHATLTRALSGRQPC
jgi:recombination protein RecR